MIRNKSTALAILQSARIAELKQSTSLVTARPPVRLPSELKRRNAWLLKLLAAERRRNAALVKELADG
jgi:hypothetical protein